MSSDEEDFNDIYGDDTNNNTPATAAAATNSGAPTATTDTIKSVTTTDQKDAENKEGDVKTVNEGTNQVDHLAALEALSSNLNQISTTNSNNINNVNNNSNNNSNSSSETNNNINSSENAVNNGSISNSTNNEGNNNNSNGLNPNPVNNMPVGAMPWEQLQQSMSQFQQPPQPPMPPQPNQQAPRVPVKADISKDNCKMFIGGLNWETTEDGLKNYFSKYGNVVELKIMKDGATGRSRGFGFLTFENPSSVDEVVKTQHILDGKVIDPKRSIPREEQDKTGKIFVGGIGTDVKPKEFEDFFAQYGTIIDAQLMLDKDTGRSRGFGFVTYDSGDAVDRVCQNKYIEFKGKQIEIKRAEPRHNQRAAASQPMNTNQTPLGMVNPMAQMYQPPVMGGFNMYNQPAMQDYYQKMQEYYQQLQQQTGIDYSQMYQQQMAMMMPGFAMPPIDPSALAQAGSGSPGQITNESNNTSNEPSSSNVQTIGEETSANIEQPKEASSTVDNHNASGSTDSSRAPDSPPLNLPRGPRNPSATPTAGSNYRGGDNGGYHSRRDGYRGGQRDNYRGHRGRGGSYNRRGNSYHPYKR